jgi:AcrR family transcriptional regulator
MRGNRDHDPRVRRTRDAAIRAAARLIEEEGIGAVTHQRVAERAGVGRATVYRHWPLPVDLVVDALSQLEQPLLRYGAGPLEAWLLAELRRAAGELIQPLAVHVTAAVVSTAHLNESAAALRDAIFGRTVAPLDRALGEAMARGELEEHPPADELLAEVLGPVLFRVVMQGVPAEDAFIERVVAGALAPWRPAHVGLSPR